MALLLRSEDVLAKSVDIAAAAGGVIATTTLLRSVNKGFETKTPKVLVDLGAVGAGIFTSSYARKNRMGMLENFGEGIAVGGALCLFWELWPRKK